MADDPPPPLLIRQSSREKYPSMPSVVLMDCAASDASPSSKKRSGSPVADSVPPNLRSSASRLSLSDVTAGGFSTVIGRKLRQIKDLLRRRAKTAEVHEVLDLIQADADAYEALAIREVTTMRAHLDVFDDYLHASVVAAVSTAVTTALQALPPPSAPTSAPTSQGPASFAEAAAWPTLP